MVALVLDSSLLVSASLPHEHRSDAQSDLTGSSPMAVLSTAAGIWAFTDGRYLSANMSTRGEIMAYILTNPGVYLREIGSDLGLPVGVVQYHIWVLTRDGDLEECKSGRYRRFFGASRYQETERRVISVIRQGTAGRILLALADEQFLSHARLASTLGLSSQALTWHMKRLEEIGVVETVSAQSPSRRAYRLADGYREVVASARPSVVAPGLPKAPSRR